MPRGAAAPSDLKRSGSRSHSATSISSSLAASTPCTSSQATGLPFDAFTVSGLVEPTVIRIIRMKTSNSTAMKKTPKTGYQLKNHSWIDSTYRIVESERPGHNGYASRLDLLAKGSAPRK